MTTTCLVPWCVEDHGTPGVDHYREVLELPLRLYPATARVDGQDGPESLAVFLCSDGTEGAHVYVTRGELADAETRLTPAEARRVAAALVAAADLAQQKSGSS